MNSLLEKEGLEGKVQMIYIDPPYGIKYGSNFQPFVNKRDVKDGKDEDLTAEPEQIKAFRDTWELGIHSYLTYLRDRLLLARELLHESGSIFVQISDENVHHVRELMDEVFGAGNFVKIIAFQTTSGLASKLIKGVYDFIIWYVKKKESAKYNRLFITKEVGLETYYDKVELTNNQVVNSKDLLEIPEGSRYLTYQPLLSGTYSETTTFEYVFHDRKYYPGSNRCWKTIRQGLDNLAGAKRIY
ncbi:site-specific DNA-methyltransferase [Synechococcus sp. Nb3U1]|uniref:DNA methyltransferase n=1 Tax=Synechococcus sp. Nb3U1 TaxID=1914529 RepID=UPI001F419978|nr:site-specific DNA-methyltransferase [Synechococcus sp. Nb3U1]MCF2971832.1 site-specific DNA-methyltransferase [Synechococcus sp. Nb3U1]